MENMELNIVSKRKDYHLGSYLHGQQQADRAQVESRMSFVCYVTMNPLSAQASIVRLQRGGPSRAAALSVGYRRAGFASGKSVAFVRAIEGSTMSSTAGAQGGTINRGASLAKTLVDLCDSGCLTTLSSEGGEGIPLGTRCPFAKFDGKLIFGLPRGGIHAVNAERQSSSSLLVQHPHFSGECQAQATLVGHLRPFSGSDMEVSAALKLLNIVQPGLERDSICLHFFDITRCYLIEPFRNGVSWIDLADYESAQPDPLRSINVGLVERWNSERESIDDIRMIAQCRGISLEDGVSVSMVNIDADGFDLCVTRLEGSIEYLRVPHAHGHTCSTERDAIASLCQHAQLAWEDSPHMKAGANDVWHPRN